MKISSDDEKEYLLKPPRAYNGLTVRQAYMKAHLHVGLQQYNEKN